MIDGSATIYGNHITRVRDANPALHGCQDGIAVLIGRQAEDQVGNALLRNNQIDLYQKGGVVVDNAGSYAWVTQNQITGDGLNNITARTASRSAAARTPTSTTTTSRATSSCVSGRSTRPPACCCSRPTFT